MSLFLGFWYFAHIGGRKLCTMDREGEGRGASRATWGGNTYQGGRFCQKGSRERADYDCKWEKVFLRDSFLRERRFRTAGGRGGGGKGGGGLPKWRVGS